MGGRDVTNKELSILLNRISDDTGILIDDVVNAFGPGNPLHSRIISRVKLDQKTGRLKPVKGKKNKKDW